MTMWDKLVLSQREEVLVAVSCLYAIDLEDFRCLDDCICSVNLFAVHWGGLGTWKAELSVFGTLFLNLGARASMAFLRPPLWESFF